jgi:hypothetical protein
VGFFVFINVKKTVYIIIVIIFTIIFSGCATRKKARDYSELRGLMLLKNTELGRNKVYNSPKYQRMLKNNYKKIVKKR